MDELASDFLLEASEALGGLQAGVARLAADAQDRAAAAEMLRRLHGLKGLCGFAGFSRAETLVHAAETLAEAAAEVGASAEALTGLADVVERLAALFAGANGLAEPEGEDHDLLAAAEQCDGGFEEAVVEDWPAVDRRAAAPWLGLDGLALALGDRLGKRIHLMVGGDDLRIAPEAAPPLRLALIALVRNACDHGIETPAERRATAKPTLSVLRLSVHRSGDGAVIELADDGRGVDPDLIRELCVSTGRLDADEAAALDVCAAQALIFASGLTTARNASPVSGRGVGLSLVREEVMRIGGTVALASTPGKGARFVLTLPASAIATPATRRRRAA